MSAKTVFASQLDEISTAAKDVLGDIRYEQSRTFKYVQYQGGTGPIQGLAGRAVGYFTFDGYKLNQVTMNTSEMLGSADSICAGILVAALQNTEFGWIQIRGLATMTVVFVGATADGDPVTLTGATNDIGDLDVNIATDANAHIAGIVCDDSDNELMCMMPF